MKDYRLLFSVPAMSRAQLMDMLGGLAMRDKRVKVADERQGSDLDTDPATVALISAGGLMAVELIRSVTQIYLEHKKAQVKKPEKPPEVQVTVHLALGDRRSATVIDAEEIDVKLADLPKDPAEIRRIQLK
jgi:hypothetical protein